MRLYYYTSKQFGIKSLWEKRLKMAEYDFLNDPYELMPYDRREKRHRVQWHPIQDYLKQSGIVCFSESWQSVLMWAHYAEKHTGLVLGFDVDVVETDKVKYIEELLPSPMSDGVENWMTTEVYMAAIQNKYIGWSYEREWRLRRPLPIPVDGIHYKPFDEELVLREVIIGERCTLKPFDVADAVGAQTPWDVKVKKARAAFGRFEICTDRRVRTLVLPGIGKERREALQLAAVLRSHLPTTSPAPERPR